MNVTDTRSWVQESRLAGSWLVCTFSFSPGFYSRLKTILTYIQKITEFTIDLWLLILPCVILSEWNHLTRPIGRRSGNQTAGRLHLTSLGNQFIQKLWTDGSLEMCSVTTDYLLSEFITSQGQVCIGFELIVELLNCVAKIFKSWREEMAGQEWWDPAQEKKGGPMKVNTEQSFFALWLWIICHRINH